MLLLGSKIKKIRFLHNAVGVFPFRENSDLGCILNERVCVVFKE